MNGFFSLYYGDNEFLLPKKDVNFSYGYGYIVAQNVLGDEQTSLIGIVDSNFEEVISLTPVFSMPKLLLAPEGNFVFQSYDNASNSYVVMRRNSEGNIFCTGASDFSVIDIAKGIVVLDFDSCAGLYDAINDLCLTPFYSIIGPFVYSEKFGCKVARASYYQEEQGEVINEFSTIISDAGEVLTPYEDLATGEKYPEKDLSEVLKLCRKPKQPLI